MKKAVALGMSSFLLVAVCLAMTSSDRQVSYADVFNPKLLITKEAMEEFLGKDEVKEDQVPEEKIYDGQVYLTFDDGPVPEITSEILDVLKEKGVKATFFTIGSYAKRNPELVKRAYDEGHTIATHSYTHQKSMFNSLEAFKSEIEKSINIIEEITGETPKYFRIPYGTKIGQTYKNYLAEKGLQIVGWNCESYDSRTYTTKPEQLLQGVKDTSKNKKEVIVIMHDTYGKQKTADALASIIEYFESINYEFKKFE